MEKVTKPNQVYEILKEKILNLDLRPGQALGEVEIAQSFGVSRTPVRDAFKKLETDGLIEIKSHIGTYVTLIDLNQISDAIFVREYIEKAIITELCNNRKISVNMRVNYLLRAQEMLVESQLTDRELASKFMELDNEFHRTLFVICNREGVWNYIQSMQYQYHRLRIFVNRANRTKLRKVCEQHSQMIMAIERQDESAAMAIYERHLYEHMLLGANDIIEEHSYFTGLKK